MKHRKKPVEQEKEVIRDDSKRSSPWRPRISIDVSKELFDRTNTIFPWGIRNSTLTAVLEQLLDAVEKQGIIVAYLIAEKKLGIFGDIHASKSDNLSNWP